jgi:hypothetical protein
MNDDDYERLWAAIQNELEVDYVSLPELISWVRLNHGDFDEDAVKDAVLGLVEYGLRIGDAEAGRYDNGPAGLREVWREDPSTIVERIRREWAALDRRPWAGDVFWLQKPNF